MFVSMQEKVAFHRGLQGTQISEADCCTYKLYLCKKGSVFATLRGMMKKTSNVQSIGCNAYTKRGCGRHCAIAEKKNDGECARK